MVKIQILFQKVCLEIKKGPQFCGFSQHIKKRTYAVKQAAN
jgi:hypothetical protein